jgi:hypothetical protein
MTLFQFSSSLYLALIAVAITIPVGWLPFKRKTPVVAIISSMEIRN